MARRADLMREIKRLRSTAQSQFSRIDKAIQSGTLPKSAAGTYFYDVMKTQRRESVSDINRKLPKLKNVELEKIVKRLQNLTEQQTATQIGIRERLREQEANADYVLNVFAGFDDDEIQAMTRYQKSRFFQLAKLFQEELGYDSDTAFEAVADTMRDSGKKASALFIEYGKYGGKYGGKRFAEKYGVKINKRK